MRKSKIERLEPRDMLTADGLLGQYFDNADLTDPADERVDERIQFPAGFVGPPVDIGAAPAGTAIQPDDNWSIRWSGHVLIETAGDWTFHTESDDGVRLWIDRQLVIDEWNDHTLRRDSATIDLDTGWQPIRLEYYQAGGEAAIQLSFAGPGQPEAVIPQSHLSSVLLEGQDIGAVAFAGSTSMGATAGDYTLTGSGSDIQGTADAFHYAHRPWTGDGEIIARVASLEQTSIFAKGGVMFRESLTAGSRHAFMQIKANRGTEFQYRAEPNGSTTFVVTDGPLPEYWVRLTRIGDTFRGYRSADGVSWELESLATVPMQRTLFVGLATTSHNNTAVTTAVFRDVTLTSLVEEPGSPTGTNVTGFIPLLTADTFDPLTDDGSDPAGFYSDNDEFYTFRGDRFDVNGAQNGPGFDEDEGKSPASDDLIFRLTPEGYLHILGNPANGQNEPFGYISTEDHYRNYHLSLDYKWGDEKFNPRNNQKRDSGLLYHAIGPDVVWTTDVETQIQEGDTGDFFFLGESPNATDGTTLGSTEGTVTVANGRYQPGGTPITTGGGTTKSITVDSLTDWNRVEVILEQDTVTVVVNGFVVNRATDLLWRDNGVVVPLTEGKIALQAEGAEIFYRNVQLKPTSAVGGRGDYRVLLFQETAGFDHRGPGSIQAAQAAVEQLGEANGFVVDVANDSEGVFTDANLRQYDAVVWNSTTGEVLNEQEQAAFERYIAADGGFVGLHAAADTEAGWDWYGDLVGARFQSHPAQQLATLRVDPEAAVDVGGSGLHHPAVDSLPLAGWQRVDEWYNFQANPRADVNVLLTLDETTYDESDGSAAADDHPIAWWHDFRGGRSFYTGLGHRPETYTEPLYLTHLLGGIEYAAGVSRVAPEDAVVLFDGSGTAAFERVNGDGAIGWQIDDDGNLAIVPGTGNIQTSEEFTDYRLHLEFKIPATSPGTSEQQRGNSGLYLHSSYELQLLDSYGDPNFDAQHAGSIYNFREADINAALPAETWQVYDVDFVAPNFDDSGLKVANARITAYLNGKLIHDDVEVDVVTNGGAPEGPGPRPFFLQDHDPNSNLKFRNIWVQPSVGPPTLAGDYNGDNRVDAADYTVWRDTVGAATPAFSGADGDGNGLIDEQDYQVWSSNYGASLPASATSQVEPANTDTASPSDDPPDSTPRANLAGMAVLAFLDSSSDRPITFRTTAITSGLSVEQHELELMLLAVDHALQDEPDEPLNHLAVKEAEERGDPDALGVRDRGRLWGMLGKPR